MNLFPKRLNTLFAALLMIVLLAACGGTETPAAVPTAAPVESAASAESPIAAHLTMADYGVRIDGCIGG